MACCMHHTVFLFYQIIIFLRFNYVNMALLILYCIGSHDYKKMILCNLHTVFLISKKNLLYVMINMYIHYYFLVYWKCTLFNQNWFV